LLGNIYGYPTRYGYHHTRSCVEVFKALIDEINQEFLISSNRSQVDSILRGKISEKTRRLVSSVTFGQNCIVIVKKTKEEIELYANRSYRFQEHL
jgi:hypothetical protein